MRNTQKKREILTEKLKSAWQDIPPESGNVDTYIYFSSQVHRVDPPEVYGRRAPDDLESRRQCHRLRERQRNNLEVGQNPLRVGTPNAIKPRMVVNDNCTNDTEFVGDRRR